MLVTALLMMCGMAISRPMAMANDASFLWRIHALIAFREPAAPHPADVFSAEVAITELTNVGDHALVVATLVDITRDDFDVGKTAAHLADALL
mmetsp:Transcript_64867/g.104198  ORF Transcript_64867/g.104198 Transcript_64867/m.104198 type:complete len:93 (-) Transcript_64867:192-470(-)